MSDTFEIVCPRASGPIPEFARRGYTCVSCHEPIVLTVEDLEAVCNQAKPPSFRCDRCASRKRAR